MRIEVFGSSSAGNCILIDADTPILIEAGMPFKQVQRAMNFQTSRLSGVLLSHSHGDHSGHAQSFAKAGVDIYASQATIDAVGLTGHRIHAIKAKAQFRLGEWDVLPFDLTHDVDNLGFLLSNGQEKLCYITDAPYCRYTFSGVTRYLVEANYDPEILNEAVASGAIPPEHRMRVQRSHMGLQTCKEFLKVQDMSLVKEIILIHLSSGNSDAAKFKTEVQKLTGKVVRIGG